MPLEKRKAKFKSREFFASLLFGLIAWQGLESLSRVTVTSPLINETIKNENLRRSPANTSYQGEQKLHFRPKNNQRYTYAFVRRITIDGLSNSIPEIAYHGKLYIDVLKSENSGFDALITDEVIGQVANPPVSLLAHVDQAGKNLNILSSSVSGESAQQHLNILKDLLANWVFPLESDTAGNYEVSFSKPLIENGFLKIKKRKLSYLKSKNPTPEILSSSHQLSWAFDLNLPYSVTGIDSTRLGSSKLSISSESHYAINFLSQEPSQVSEAKLVGITHEENLELSGDKSGAVGKRREPNAHLSWSDLTRQLADLSSMSSPQQLQLFGDLLDFLRNHKTDMKDLTAFLSPTVMSAGAASPLFKMTVGAMATLGTPEAQAALIGVYQDPNCPVSGKGTVLAALTTTQAQATASTRDFLIDESRNQSNPDLSNGALWALGSSLNATTTSDSSSQKAVASIEQHWALALTSSSPEGEEMVLLDAMGNSGRPQFLPILESVIEDSSNPTLQSKAVFSLRFIPTADAQGLLIKELSDPNPNLRLASAKALSLAPWNAAFMTPLQSCATHEQVPEVKSACQTVLQNQET